MRPELLLHPNIPKPLHGMSPRELLGAAWWDATRYQSYERAYWKCQCCGVPKQHAEFHQWLEAHETYEYDYAEGLAVVTEIVALCHACHNYIHSGYLRSQVRKGRIPQQKYDRIMQRGDTILATTTLTRLEPPARIAEWSKWRIEIAGRVFPTKWPSYEAWAEHYGR